MSKDYEPVPDICQDTRQQAKIQLWIRMRPTTYACLRRISARTNRTMSQIAREVLERWEREGCPTE